MLLGGLGDAGEGEKERAAQVLVHRDREAVYLPLWVNSTKIPAHKRLV